MTLRGLDVSRWNAPHSVPWDEVDFGFVRLTYGLYVDPRAEEHLWNGRKAGKLLGGYHWLDCSDGAWASDQSALFLATYRKLCPDYEIALAVDVEPSDPKKPDRPARVVEALHFFLLAVDIPAKPGSDPQPCAVYLNRAEVQRIELAGDRDALPDDLALAPLWLADWTPPYEVPAPWVRWTVLQTGKKGGVDRDVFDGDADDFRRAFGICALD